MLERYLAGDIDRAEAVDRVGPVPGRRAEREGEAVEDDARWGLDS